VWKGGNKGMRKGKKKCYGKDNLMGKEVRGPVGRKGGWEVKFGGEVGNGVEGREKKID
jgi:hypothetical protein